MYSDNNKSQGSVATHLRCGGLALLQNYRSDCIVKVKRVTFFETQCIFYLDVKHGIERNDYRRLNVIRNNIVRMLFTAQRFAQHVLCYGLAFVCLSVMSV